MHTSRAWGKDEQNLDLQTNEITSCTIMSSAETPGLCRRRAMYGPAAFDSSLILQRELTVYGKVGLQNRRHGDII